MPDNVDWVTTRFRCSIGQAFERLRAEVGEDVKQREELRPKDERHSHYAFSFADSHAKHFSAIVEGHQIHEHVKFELHDHWISARLKDGKDLKVTPTINDDAECVLRVDTKEYNFWQFRKLVLEELFFYPR
jgi:hypothetical protein